MRRLLHGAVRHLVVEIYAVTHDGRVLVTEGIADQFTPQEGSGYTYETVS